MSNALHRRGRGARLPASGGIPHAMLSLAHRAAAWVARAPLAAILATLVLLQAWALWRAPDAWYPASIEVRLAPGDTVTLGAPELAAPRAAAAHVQLSRDVTGDWRLRNLSTARPVTVQRDGADWRLAGAPVTGATAFQAGGARFMLAQAGSAAIAFRHAGHDWRYDGATLYRNGKPQPPCAGTPLAARAGAWWNRLAPAFATWPAPLAIGGHVHCGNRLGVATLAPGAAIVARHGGQLRLAAGPGDDGNAALLVQSPAGTLDVRRLEVALAGVKSLSVAGARYTVQALSGNVLALAPTRHVALSGAAHMADSASPAASWQWRRRSPWWPADGWPGRLAMAALAVAVLSGLAAAVPPPVLPQRKRWRLAASLAATAAVLAAGVAAMAALRAGTPLPAAGSLLLAVTGIALWGMPRGHMPVAARTAPPPHGHMPMAVGAALVLAMTGLMMQLELGLAAPDLAALRHYHKGAALLAAGSALAACWRLWRAHAGRHPIRQRGAEWALAVLTGVALAALAAQALWGDETGVFDMQPVELAKIALAALTAHALALHMGGPSEQHRRWLHLAAPALLFGALLGMALVSVDDYSPLILLVVWAGCTALAYAVAARRLLLAAVLVLAALMVAAAVWALHDGGADVLARLPQGFYADRFQVWLAPAGHPHTGQQWLQGARAIAAGGWLGADHALGLLAAGMPDGAAAAIPAVQDDFAPAFFLYRHGLLAALLLWACQAAMLAGLLRQAAACHRRATAAQGFGAAWRERLQGFLLCGGAAFLFGHFLLSWGTNLAIFPVMGQPMSFLSAGGSHLLFFLCPLLAVSMDAGPPAPLS